MDFPSLCSYASRLNVQLPAVALDRMNKAISNGTDPRELAHFVRGLAYRQAHSGILAERTESDPGTTLALRDVKDMGTLRTYGIRSVIPLRRPAGPSMPRATAER